MSGNSSSIGASNSIEPTPGSIRVKHLGFFKPVSWRGQSRDTLAIRRSEGQLTPVSGIGELTLEFVPDPCGGLTHVLKVSDVEGFVYVERSNVAWWYPVVEVKAEPKGARK